MKGGKNLGTLEVGMILILITILILIVSDGLLFWRVETHDDIIQELIGKVADKNDRGDLRSKLRVGGGYIYLYWLLKLGGYLAVALILIGLLAKK